MLCELQKTIKPVLYQAVSQGRPSVLTEEWRISTERSLEQSDYESLSVLFGYLFAQSTLGLSISEPPTSSSNITEMGQLIQNVHGQKGQPHMQRAL